ncbi:MAG: DUF126 domain-containing protein [Tetrasphaera jenkinsii]|jgi:predicted aconitase with swiveling domain|nr:DUF126 domain-containing protein [Tetrasphaera jenkinsii]
MSGERGAAEITGVAQTGGRGIGPVIRLDPPLSFWGGVGHDGTVIDPHHPRAGESLAGTVLVMERGRGSSSSSSVLAELIRTEQAPAAIVLAVPEPIIALGAIVAAELYGVEIPVVTVTAADLAIAARWSSAEVVADAAKGAARVIRR